MAINNESITVGVYMTKQTQKEIDFLEHELGEKRSKVISRAISYFYEKVKKEKT